MQENRSFDHYFGTLSGVAGFDDPLVPRDWRTGRTAFEQLDPSAQDGANGLLLPWHLPVATSSAHCLTDVSHTWQVQHQSMNGGKNDTWVSSHVTPDTQIAKVSDHPAAIVNGGARVMSYFTRDDLPFHYALADTFTVCDRYFCSVIGPTIPNRLYLMSASIDPAATHGGPGINNFKNGFSWTTYPERLQAAGIDWRLYREGDDFGDNMLDHFAAYQDRTSDLFRRGRTVLASGKVPNISQPGRTKRQSAPGFLDRRPVLVHRTPGIHAGRRRLFSPAGARSAYVKHGGLAENPVDRDVRRKRRVLRPRTSTAGATGHAGRIPDAGRAGDHSGGGWHRRPDRSWTAGADDADLAVHPRWPGQQSHVRPHLGPAVTRNQVWRRGAQPDALAAGHLRRPRRGHQLRRHPATALPTLPDTAALLREAVEECKTQPPPQVPVEQVMPRQEHGFRRRPSGPIF